MFPLFSALVLAACWERLDTLPADCSSCVPGDQCFEPLPPSGARFACTLGSGQTGVCCDNEHQLGSERRSGDCTAPVLCQPVDSDGAEVCSLPDGSSGVICTPPPTPGPLAGPARHLVVQRHTLSAPPDSFAIDEAQQQASLASAELAELEERLTANLHRPGAAAADLFGLQTAATGDPAVAQEVGRIGLQRLFTIQAIANQTTLTTESFGGDLTRSDLDNAAQRMPGCVPAAADPCDVTAAANRSLSGQCNHVEHPFLGRSLTGLGRLTSATYEDHLFFEPRTQAADGSPLPSPESAGSLVVRQHSVEPLSRWATTLSEYLSLDLARTSPFHLPGGREPDCCTEQHPACLRLRVNERCVNFVRVLPAPELDCVMRPAAPLSTASSYLDLEVLYGSSEEAGRQLRTFQGGRLRADLGLLPDKPGSGQVVDLDYDLYRGASEEIHLRRRRSELGRASSQRGIHRYTVAQRGPATQDDDFRSDFVTSEDGSFSDNGEIERVLTTGGKLKGAKGNKGMKGGKGMNGAPGTKGGKGDPGEKGKKGNDGMKGMIGPPGMKGDRGFPGSKGSRGPQGPKGPKGKDGMKGDQGNPGFDGVKGDDGPEGPRGPRGPRGPKGKDGMKGDRGNPGLDGVQGDEGPQGIQGTPGLQGSKGKEGVKGDQGKPGVKGDMGFPGPEGPGGPPGPEGPRGKKGMKGDQGDEGPAGNPGQKGKKGDVGMKGDQGLQGEKGKKGDVGMEGEQGAPGRKGRKGDEGPEGPSGPAGPKGPKGDRGAPGPPGKVEYIYVNKPSSEYGAPQPTDHHAPSREYSEHRPAPSSRYGAPHDSWAAPRGGYKGSASLFRPRRLQTPGRLALRPSADVAADELHQLLLREHNRVADAVRRNHPLWEDERVFQLARRVVVAEWQHITYREYLPHLLGATTVRHLALPSTGDAGVDPMVSVEFAAAAFRFWQLPKTTELRQVTGSSTNGRRSFLDVIRGTVTTAGTRSTLAADGGSMSGTASSELAAVDVLRGRELGLPTYAAMHELCTGRAVSNWTDLEGVMGRQELEALRATYASPLDVDLWVGGMLEGRAPAAKVGPTFQCVIADQFRRLRVGDRLFYETSLSSAQLGEVRKASLARLLCDNQPGGRDGALPLMLEPISAQNKMSLCSAATIPRPNLDLF